MMFRLALWGTLASFFALAGCGGDGDSSSAGGNSGSGGTAGSGGSSGSGGTAGSPLTCGDGTCGSDETCTTCPSDCTCPEVCGNATCDSNETCATCADDCGECIPDEVDAQIVIEEPEFFHASGYFPPLGMSLSSGFAPFPVFFEGWPSTPRDRLVRWQWDYGAGTETDPHGRYAEGFNGAHVFETPGTYTVTLTATDADGHSDGATTTITVLAPSGTTYYVDAAIGDDACNGTSQTASSATDCPWRTATKAFANMRRSSQDAPPEEWPYQPGDRILFRRGQTFEIEQTVDLGHGYGTQGYTFAAYGDSADPKPVIHWIGAAANDSHMLTGGYGTGYIAFVDLSFDFLGPTTQLTGLIFAPEGWKSILFLRSEFRDHHNSVFLFHGDDPTHEPTGIFMIDCHVDQSRTFDTAVTHMFGGPGRFAMIGNTLDNSGNHISYMTSINKGVISNNVFARPAFGRTALRVIGGADNDDGGANNLYIADNLFLGWIDPVTDDHAHNNSGAPRYNYHLINFAPGGNEGPLYIRDVLFERNVITNFESAIDIANAERFTMRNNLFITPAESFTALTLSNTTNDLGHTRPLNDVRIIGNTFVATAPTGDGRFISIHPWDSGGTPYGDTHQSVVIENNVFHSAPGRADTVIAFSSGGSADQLSVSDHNAFVAEHFAVGATLYDLAAWRAATGHDTHSVAGDPGFTGAISSPSYAAGEPSYAQVVADANAYTASVHLADDSAICEAGALLDVDSTYDYAAAARYASDNLVSIGALECQ